MGNGVHSLNREVVSSLLNSWRRPRGILLPSFMHSLEVTQWLTVLGQATKAYRQNSCRFLVTSPGKGFIQNDYLSNPEPSNYYCVLPHQAFKRGSTFAASSCMDLILFPAFITRAHLWFTH